MSRRPPKHKNPTRRERTAVAPYNFVPITDRVIAFNEDKNPLTVSHDRYDERRYTGWIDVELETKTPIYVRAPLTETEFAQTEQEKEAKTDISQMRNKPDFFYTADKNQPVIPGSSLRGMIRSMVELVAHGKLNPVTNSQLIYRAVGDTSSHGDAYREQLFESDPTQKNYFTPRFRGGYMRRDKTSGDWYIQPAKEVSGTTFARINLKRVPRNLKRWQKSKNASEIFVAINDYDYKEVRGGFVHVKRAQVVRANSQDEDGLVKAVLARSGRVPKKATEVVIFDVDETAESIPIPNDPDSEAGDLIAAYREQISPEQKKLLGNNGVLIEEQPILYLMDDDKLVFFGHTQMFRIPYRYSPRAMLPPEHRAEQLVDIAESMFGRVKRRQSIDGSQAIAGRIFVEDAVLQPGQSVPWLPDNPIVTPKILASPKATTFQHYLTQPRSDVEKGKGLETYNSSPRRTTLRGHKMYWHKGSVQRQDYEADKDAVQGKESQYTRIKPVREGVTFKFRIRFENLAAAELGALWWAVALPASGEHYHKIGMGKPLGLGTIKLTPTLQIYDPKQRYSKLFSHNHEFDLGVVADNITQKIKDESINIFEGFICKQLGYPTFAKSERIQMLLEMLGWPGPDPKDTRYMEIERDDPRAKRGKRNEYRERPVLPDPENVQE